MEGDCPPLDAWFASDSDPPRAAKAGEEDRDGDEERRGRDRELREEEEASRLLRSWCVCASLRSPTKLSWKIRTETLFISWSRGVDRFRVALSVGFFRPLCYVCVPQNQGSQCSHSFFMTGGVSFLLWP